LMYPPVTVTPEMLWLNDRRRFHTIYSFYCGCESSPEADTVRMADGFGYWRSTGWDPETTFHFTGYIMYDVLVHRCMAQPCPIGSPGPVPQKDYIYFTDSTYAILPDNAIPCGQSRLYFLANVFGCDSIFAHLSLPGKPEVRVRMERDQYVWDVFRGSYESGVRLGLKSFNQVTLEAEAYTQEAADANIKPDKMNIALPIVVYPRHDTIYIDHDLMKFEDNITVGVQFRNDITHSLLDPHVLLTSIGYRLRTKWIANENRQDNRALYTRIFPLDSSYRMCQQPLLDNFCSMTFKKDSLPVVGGDLTIDVMGTFRPIANLPSNFQCDSDSILSYFNKKPRYHIVIDEDPSNTEFIAELGSDIMRALAWAEGAGGYPPYPPHQQTFDPYNHYWEDATKVPCENSGGTATGIMQMLRTDWEEAFDSATYTPTGYYRCKWDSLAWSWKINIANGKYIYFINYRSRLRDYQEKWDSVCVECEVSDSVPKYPNREDLLIYGYTNGSGKMRQVTTLNWDDRMGKDIYVKRVRGNKHEKPWQ
jgi:hypothetical protein